MNRIQSVDVFRLVSILAIIFMHTQVQISSCVRGQSALFVYIHDIICISARFAVPFFFVISGYFFGIKVRNGYSVGLTSIILVKRLLLIFFAWSFIYVIPYDVNIIYKYGILKASYIHLHSLISKPINFIFVGTSSYEHLWFLVALIASILITSFFIKHGMFTTLITTALALYIVGVLASSYSRTPIGIHINFNTRNGPFLGTLFFVSGYCLSKNVPSLFYGVYLLCIGIIMHFSEIYYLNKLYGGAAYYDYVFGTYFMGLGVAIIAFSNHKLLRNYRLANIGKLTLGVYLIHMIFVDLLGSISYSFLSPKLRVGPFWGIGFPIIVFGASLASVSFLSKYKYTRKIIT